MEKNGGKISHFHIKVKFIYLWNGISTNTIKVMVYALSCGCEKLQGVGI